MQDMTEKLAQAVLQQLEAGIFLNKEVVHYLESTTGAATARQLEQELDSGDTSELCSVLELIFYPDRQSQCTIEPLLEKHQPAEKDLDRLGQILCDKNIRTRLIFPDNTMTRPVLVPEDSLLAYIRRLNLLRRIDTHVAQAINEHIADHHEILNTRVMLRNSRIAFVPQVVSFLCDFFRIIVKKGQNWKASFEFMIPLLESADTETDIYAMLMDKKRHCSEMLRRAESASEQLKQIPVEAMIMRGANIACMGVDEARAHMAIIDETALYIFGKTETTEFSDQPVTLRF